VGFRGKIDEQNRARDLRAEGWTMPEIAAELGVARSSVSLWVRDVPYVPRRPPRRGFVKRGPNKLERAKQEEIGRLLAEGQERIGALSDREFLIAGTALYAGEGFKVRPAGMANTDPLILLFFVRWLRHFFDVDESRLKMTLYLHRGLDLDVATAYWSQLVDIPPERFLKPYRAEPDPSIRRSKHPMGCPRITYTCSRTHRAMLGLVGALLASSVDFPG
jgi:transcriptional regulator with XRE-family HTH domain